MESVRDGSIYLPVMTEYIGVVLVGYGLYGVGAGTALKVQEFFTGREVLGHFGNDAQFCMEFGRASIQEGMKRILPTVAAVTLIYFTTWGK